MKKLAFLAASLAEGAVIIPNLIFIGLIQNHYGNYYYIFPFVLLYAFEKAGIFFIKGFGEVLNPYLLLKRLMIPTFIGSIFMMAGTRYHVLWDIGAILIGVGLSAYSALYRTIVDIQKELNIPTDKNTVAKAYLFLLVFIAVVISIRHTHYNIMFLLFFIYITIICVYIWKLEIPESMVGQQIFRKKKKSTKYFIHSLFILIFVLSVRFLKQTANIQFVFPIFIMLCLLIFALNIPEKRSLNKSSLQILVIGGMRNYLTIYSLIFYTAIGETTKVMISYALIFVGMFISIICSKKINNIFKLKEPFNLYLLGSCFGMIVMLVPYCYFIGIIISAFFVTAANKEVTQNIISKENIGIYEKRLVKEKFYGLGAVMQQAILLIVLLVVSFLLKGKANLALSAYVYSLATPQLTVIFRITGLICSLSAIVWSFMLVKKF